MTIDTCAFAARPSSRLELSETPARPNGERGPGETPEVPLVLVVDDDPDMRFVYMDCLSQSGYRTAGEGEGDGVSGVEAAFRLRPDAILMDVAMPGISGIEATRRIKADPRTRGCFVIVMTGYGMAKFEEAQAAGCDAFLCKPFEASALENALRALSTSMKREKVAEPPGIVKRCGCGREFSREQWFALPLCGRTDNPPRELRNCTCGSSLAVKAKSLMDTPIAETVLEAVAEPDAQRLTVFVVDRDPHVRRLIQRFVGDTYAVEFFDNGSSALERVRRCPPSALITEILVPRLDGLELCRVLKQDPITVRVPVLIFSMLAAGKRAQQSGADAFLAKPLERDRFVAFLRRLIELGERGDGLPLRAQGAA